MTGSASRATGRRPPARGDMTALRKVALEEERDQAAAEEARLAAEEAEADSRDRKNRVIDYTGTDTPLPEVAVAEDQDEPYREIIIKHAIEKMAFGREILADPELDARGNVVVPARLGNIRFFDFEEGRRYRVPRELADHLDERGLVYH